MLWAICFAEATTISELTRVVTVQFFRYAHPLKQHTRTITSTRRSPFLLTSLRTRFLLQGSVSRTYNAALKEDTQEDEVYIYTYIFM